MAGRCTICTHPARAAIDEALVAGSLSNRRIAAQYGVGETSLRRHKRAHLAKALVAAKAAQEASRADDLLAQVRALQAKALSLLRKAEAQGDLRTALQGVREARGCLELLAELTQQLARRPTVNILLAPEWQTVRSVLLMALYPYPEARAAVAARLLELEAGNGRGG